uniref:Uncharacterized protein TCIL3000_9_4000 n=1 Tax=Trypanosoma congolense (strain IL3000) TaxID=1068625 RepID=G0UUD6_TRYCI|nr:unnamed protein product [Trypanosoma congolense IL3000]
MIRYICATSRREKLLLFISICFTAIFISTGVEWVLTRRRTELQAILTVMHPSFMEVPVDPSVGNFYKVWRYYDYGADSFRHLEAESFPAVPIIYIHGNAGCYQDMRSLGRFVGESTSKLRRENAYRYDERVKGAIFDLYKRDKREMPKDGTTIPRNIQMEAENAVILETPMLGAELFAADFREESNAHSGILMAKEALYLNHSAHVLVQRFLDHYKTVLQEPASDIRRKREEPAQEIVLLAEREYIESGCNVWPLDVPDPSICWSLRKEVSTFSTTERIRREVQRLQREGIWLWTESLGGVVGVFAAVLAPELYAGLVMAGPPLRYPPLLFDAGAVLFQKVIHDAVTMQYINTGRFHRNWSAVFEAPNIYGLLQNLNSIPSAELAGRLDRVSLLNLHGGALEDIIPTRSSQIVRTASRAMQSAEHQFMMGIKPRHAARRDICTEELRGCGLTLTHRGLVYAMQLLDSAGYYVVKTALTRDAGELLGIESMLPPGRDRLFPMILETLLHGMDKRNEEKLLLLIVSATTSKRATTMWTTRRKRAFH